MKSQFFWEYITFIPKLPVVIFQKIHQISINMNNGKPNLKSSTWTLSAGVYLHHSLPSCQHLLVRSHDRQTAEASHSEWPYAGGWQKPRGNTGGGRRGGDGEKGRRGTDWWPSDTAASWRNTGTAADLSFETCKEENRYHNNLQTLSHNTNKVKKISEKTEPKPFKLEK